MSACVLRGASPLGAATRAPRSQAPAAGRRLAVSVRAAKGGNMDKATGFVAEDNSGRSNIFPTRAQPYLRSSTADAAAKQGLGGAQGGILLGFVIGVVALITVVGTKAPGPETLQTVTAAYEGDTVTAIAARLKASL